MNILRKNNMQELECVREKLQNKYRVVKTDEDLEWNRAIDLCTNIINAHLSRENDPEIARSSRDNDGWIPVEERLPEVFGKYWATIRYDDGRISEPIVVDFRGVRQKYVVDTPNGREYETWGIDSAFHGSRVIAWRPYYIPEPYRPERSGK